MQRFLYIAVFFGFWSCADSKTSEVSSKKPPLAQQGFVISKLVGIEPAPECSDRGYVLRYESLENPAQTFGSTTCYHGSELGQGAMDSGNQNSFPEFFSDQEAEFSDLSEYCEAFLKQENQGGGAFSWGAAYYDSTSPNAIPMNEAGPNQLDCHVANLDDVKLVRFLDKPESVADLRILSHFSRLSILRIETDRLPAYESEYYLPSSLSGIEILMPDTVSEQGIRSIAKSLQNAASNAKYLDFRSENPSFGTLQLDFSFVTSMPSLRILKSDFAPIDFTPLSIHPALRVVDLGANPTKMNTSTDLGRIESFRFNLNALDASSKYEVQSFYFHP